MERIFCITQTAAIIVSHTKSNSFTHLVGVGGTGRKNEVVTGKGLDLMDLLSTFYSSI